MVDVATPGEAYLTSLYLRSAAFRAYLEQLAGEISAPGTTIRSAINSFIYFSLKLEEQARQVVEGDDEPIAVLGPLLNHLRNVEEVADQLFSRGHALDVPRSLRSTAVRELDRLKLTDITPVIVIGRPRNFETYITDLREFMFGMLDLVDLDEPMDALTMICLPYLEGTRALWQPVTIGHEIGHLAENSVAITERLYPLEWITAESATRLREVTSPEWFDDRLDRLREAGTVLTNWVREIVCDLHTIRRFGPAGFAAIAEFLLSIGGLDVYSETHPPGRFRIHCMRLLLGDELGAYAPVIAPWLKFGSATLDQDDSGFADTLADVVLSNFSSIVDGAAGLLHEVYDWRSREHVAAGLCASFIEFIPAVDLEAVGSHDITQEDILNAGWLARAYQESATDRIARSKVLVTLDSIVTKALDDLDFLALWREAHKEGDEYSGTDTRDGRDSTVHRPSQDSGALAAKQISGRLRSSVGQNSVPEPLIVTPYFAAATEGAALDVRLSTKFITFRRSATPVFDSLDADQDPREMQEYVEKDWAGRFILHPLELVLASTLEYIAMPSDLTAQVITRSSHGRLGLLSATAVQIHPYFRGCLTLELVNLGQMPLALTPGERIAQLVFFPIQPAPPPAQPKYEFPIGPQFSRVRGDADLDRLRTMREIRKSL